MSSSRIWAKIKGGNRSGVFYGGRGGLELDGVGFMGGVSGGSHSRRPVGPRRAKRLGERSRRLARRGRWPIAVVAAVGISLAVPLIATRWTADEDPGCVGERTSIVVAASVDKAPVLAQFAADFSRNGSYGDGKCVSVLIAPKTSGEAERALVAGWPTENGPRPDVYSPASSVWLPILEEQLAAKQQSSLTSPASEVKSIASSPEVVAMPRPMAMALGWPSQLIGWRDILALAQDPAGWGTYGRPEWGRFTLGKANPRDAQSGLDATIATYYAGAGTPGRLKTSNLSSADIASPQTRKFVAGVEQSILRYGDSSLPFLADWQRADQAGTALTYLSALVTQESLVQAYNDGNPTADPAKAGQLPRPKVPLVAVYPREGTLYTDHPFAILKGSWVSPAKRAAAEAFLAYLRSDESQRRWQANNFRSYDRRPGPTATLQRGVQPFQPTTVLKNPTPAVVAEIISSWQELRKKANILTLVDASGSMAQVPSGESSSKFALAAKAVTKSFDFFTDRDEVGLWAFGATAEGIDYQELVPIGPMTGEVDGGSRRRVLAGALADVKPAGRTALYGAISSAYRQVLSRARTDTINSIVVLSDGKNDDQDGPKLVDLLKLVAGSAAGPSVRIVTIAYGPDADRVTLQQIAQASRGAAYVAPTPAELPKVYASALANV